MGNLDLLFEYQKADLELEAFEQRIKSSPARQQLSKLRAHLVEQQSQWQKITVDAETKAASYEASLKRFEALLAQFEKRKLEFEEHEPENLGEAETFAKLFENLHEQLTNERKAVYKELEWLNQMSSQVNAIRKDISRGKKEFDALKQVCDKELADAQNELNELKKKLEEFSKPVPKELLAKYKRIKQNHSMPMARLENNQCGGCHMDLPVVVTRQMKDPKKVVECENCGRILF